MFEVVGMFFLLAYLFMNSAYGFDGPSLYQLTAPVDHGEGPTWDHRTELLYFVDIHNGKVLSYNPVTDGVGVIQLEGTTYLVIPTRSSPNHFIVGVNRSVLNIEWDGKGSLGATRILTEVSKQFPTSRLNDGKADKNGRLWIGTMRYEGPSGVSPDEGVLYLIDKHTLENPVPLIHPVNVSNGIAWNKANTKFYYIDSRDYSIVSYDFNGGTGTLSNRRVVFDMRKLSGIGGNPDGMTIDKDDNLWTAIFGGGCVLKIDPRNGSVLQMIALPATYVSSVAWGGKNLDVLFVTTSRFKLSKEDRLKQPAAGSLFAITNLETSGLPSFFADF